MKSYKFENIDWLTGQEIIFKFNKLLYGEKLDNKNFVEDLYVWNVGRSVLERLSKFYPIYPINNMSYLGIDMILEPDLCKASVITLREKDKNETRFSRPKIPYCSADVNKMISSLADHRPRIKKVIFNNPATIVFWYDGSKTVVKAENEPFDPEKGLAMAISKKALGNQGNYYDTFREWLPKEEDTDTGYCPSWLRGFSEKYGL